MQQLEPDDNDWDDGCRNDAVDIMETEEPEGIVILFIVIGTVIFFH